MMHLQTTLDDLRKELTDLDAKLTMPCFFNPLTSKAFSKTLLDKAGAGLILHHIKCIKETKGMIIYTFKELETHTIQSLTASYALPPLYPVGPILNMLLSNSRTDQAAHGNRDSDKIIKWLDDQPPKSILFLCFGSVGCFGNQQVKEKENALVDSEVQFVWLMLEPNKDIVDNIDTESECSYARRVLSEEFFDRTAGLHRSPSCLIWRHEVLCCIAVGIRCWRA